MPQVNDPDVAASSNSAPQSQLLPDFAPYSQDSEQDVTAYAETVVQRLEQAHETAPISEAQSANETSTEIQVSQNPDQTDSNPETRRSSTPILLGGTGDIEVNLSALESALDVVFDPESQLPERLATIGTSQENITQIPVQADEDNASSLCDAT